MVYVVVGGFLKVLEKRKKERNHPQSERSTRMFRYPSYLRTEWPRGLWLKRIIFSSLILICASATILAQEVQRTQPTWWFGGSGAVNINLFYGATQVLNATTTTHGVFHNGDGTGLNTSFLLEYRPGPVWGGILAGGYDTRNGTFNSVNSPITNYPGSLHAELKYISIEPSLRIAPFSSGFYIFGGPILNFNLWNEFTYTQKGNPELWVESEWSDLRKFLISGQVGMGYDIPLSSPNAATQVNLSPFIAFLPDVEGPRTVESWDIYTVRIGAALKFGSGDVIARADAPRPVVVERDVEFSIRAPKAVPVQRKVRETFPLRNYVFFDDGSSEVPTRYVALTKDQAAKFKEAQLQEIEPMNMTGRSQRQLALYHNILNILGDRLRSNPGASVTLTGASEKGATEGQAFAESIKRYLTTVFGVDGSRIATEGRDKPRVPSEQPGGTRELTLLRAEDRRVDIESQSPELLMQVGGPYDALKPAQIIVVQEDPLDSHVMFHVAGAREALSSWSLEVSSERGSVQRFGPFTRDLESIPGRSILGDRTQGDYKVVMLGQSKTGRSVRKEGSVHLVRQEEPKTVEALRFSILFEFNTSKTVATYSTFLTEMVAPLIPDGGKVIIHGHTDIIGDDEYNMTLSNERAAEARDILHQAISKSGKTGVTIESYGFGEDLRLAPFDNNLPGERCYNRTVIIDIVPTK